MIRNSLTVPVQRVEHGAASPVQDWVAVEEPLEIEVNGKTVSITMRTPGNDFELAAGFLFTEGILEGRHQVRSIAHAAIPQDGNPRQAGNSILVTLEDDVEVDFERLERHFYMTSSCGVCGKASIEALQSAHCQAVPRGVPVVEASVIDGLPARIREAQTVFQRTGGLHAAALFDPDGALLSLREDVGRHNAVDKVIGTEVLEGRVPCSGRIILVSGRASFELMQKTLMAGIPILAAVGAPSSLAVETAQRFGMTLLGFVRQDRFNIYSGAERIR